MGSANFKHLFPNSLSLGIFCCYIGLFVAQGEFSSANKKTFQLSKF